jgi:hypothetical protein
MAGIDSCAVCSDPTRNAMECPYCGAEVCSDDCLTEHVQSEAAIAESS